MDAFHAEFGRRIQRLRKSRGLTQEETARRAGIHATYLSGVERGLRNPSLKNIRAIAQALGAQVGDLFSFENENCGGGGNNSR